MTTVLAKIRIPDFTATHKCNRKKRSRKSQVHGQGKEINGVSIGVYICVYIYTYTFRYTYTHV